MSSDKIMTINFYHGRQDPDQAMDDWGEDGPTFELKFVTWTYGMVNLIGFAGGEENEDLFFRDLSPQELFYYEGWYYGDFSIDMLDRDDPKTKVKDFDLSKSYIPIIEQKREQSKTKGQ